MRAWKAVVGLAATACLMASCAGGQSGTGGTARTVRPLPNGKEGPRSAIPWSDVGRGWTVATWSSTKAGGQSGTLFLVDPQGGRYSVAALPSAENGNSSLAGWSGDGRRVLLITLPSLQSVTSVTMTEISLASGKSHSFSIEETPGDTYNSPAGRAILVNVGDALPLKLEQLSLDGQMEHAYPGTFSGAGLYDGDFASSPDGSQIAMGEAKGQSQIALVSKSGGVVKSLTVPGTTSCTPTRWWNTAEILATCQPVDNGHPLLWLVPTSGAAPIPLTVAGPPSSDNGDQGAWQVGGSVYVQDVGGCGYEYLAKRTTRHTTSPVYVPLVNSRDSVEVLGAAGQQLLVRASVACGPGGSLLSFDPARGTSRVMLGQGMNGGSVNSALLFGTNNGGPD